VIYLINKRTINKKKLKRKIALTPLFPFIFLWFFFKYLLRRPIDKNGIHCISGRTGSGKTLLASVISRKLSEQGITVYSNSRFNNRVKTFDITDHFDDFEIKKPLENGVVVFDEIQKDFNKRLNQRGEYNSVFIPLVEWLTTHRHHGIKKVYFITQSWDRLDVQLQDLIHRVHFVWSSFVPSYKHWIRHKAMPPFVRPYTLKFYSRHKEDFTKDDFDRYVKKGKINYRPPKKFKERVTIEELIDFETYAFKRANIEKKATYNRKKPSQQSGKKAT